MPSASSQPQIESWLAQNGPRELELLFRAIVFHPAVPILITDSDRRYLDASTGAGKLLGVPREKIIGKRLDDFAEPAFKPRISELWEAFLTRGEQEGALRLVGPDGKPTEVEYTAKGNVLPVRHALVLHPKSPSGEAPGATAGGGIPKWLQDFALFLLNPEGKIAAWYSGAQRIYGYSAAEAVGKPVAMLYPSEDTLHSRLGEELKRSWTEGHFGNETWCMRKDGTRFWANVITMALKDGSGELRGFARVVRDFTERHERDEKLRRTRARLRPSPVETTIAGIVSGEFDRIPEANDAFLELVGYSREDLQAGRLSWPDLTPPEYLALDEIAHEEGLQFGACTPFEKELTRKDGTRIPVLVATAVLKLSPFRWITFVQDLRERVRSESAEPDAVDMTDGFAEIVGRQSFDEEDIGAGGSGCRHKRDRADPGRNGNREGVDRARGTPDQPAPGSSFHHAELRRHSRGSAGE